MKCVKRLVKLDSDVKIEDVKHTGGEKIEIKDYPKCSIDGHLTSGM